MQSTQSPDYHESDAGAKMISERATNEMDDHEEQHDNAPHCGIRDSPLQDIFIRHANPSTHYTSKASQELDPRLSVMPTVPADDPTMVNETPEENPDVNKGKEKATLVPA